MTLQAKVQIKARDRDAIIASFRAGVVPRTGLQHVQVGRHAVVEALDRDIDRIVDGGATIRFLTADYGTGKTFLISVLGEIGRHKKMVVCNADLSPDRRLYGAGGQARSLYTELMSNLTIRAYPDKGALKAILETAIHVCAEEADRTGSSLEAVISGKLAEIRDIATGFDFARVVILYAKAYEDGNSHLQDCILRWLRAEYATKSEARADLGVRSIIDDSTVYDSLRVFARFVRIAGYGGLLVCVDEMVNIYNLQNSQARKQNHEQILRILNDVLQGTTEAIGFIFAGTPEFVFDGRRGLYSYAALKSRLAVSAFARNGLADYNAPVIQLADLTPEELFHLLERLRDVFAYGDPTKWLIPDEGLHAFMQHWVKVLSSPYGSNTRNFVRAFVDLLALLEQNPSARWTDLLAQLHASPEATAANGTMDDDDDELTSLRF